jgi:hypothetical protein
MSTLSEITDVMRELLQREQFSDMEIICQDVTFKAHRAIVCTQSSFFNSAFCDGFKVYAEEARLSISLANIPRNLSSNPST